MARLVKDSDKVTEIKSNEPKEPEVIDIDLRATARRKFRINGDNNRLVELDPSDLSILTRVEDANKGFAECIEQIKELSTSITDTDDDLADLGKRFKAIDAKMRKLIDDIFQSNVSEVCAPTGSMYDPINGKFRYEHIMDALMTFYANNIQSEYKKMNKNVSKRTSKYTNK